jgi:hypothetical protein
LAVFLLYAANTSFLENRELKCNRSELLDIKKRLSNASLVASAFPSHRREQAEEDWHWVLGRPWSPVKTIDQLLEQMPDELDVSPEVVLPEFHAFIKEWIAAAEKLK